ncbi:hypothetical protein QM012_003875 [Aureobasidium pullulans]|uniref:Mif2 N-terminal domain-containing protein n=1 Tax=Aureobasidium pullulans TaxID=5580 RepID=A0ABR0T720_AURPU
MTAIDARHERHMMRQRGAGARSIPTNFGFIFQAGPIQVSDKTVSELPLPANTSPTAHVHTQPHHTSESTLPSEVPAQKRKRVVREDEDDQVWFKKRTKKTTTQEQKDHPIITTTSDSVLDVTQEEPPPDKKPAKRKVVRKRVLVPRSRKKESLKPQLDQPSPPPESKTKKPRSSQDLWDEHIDLKTQKKAVPRKKAVQKYGKESVETKRPSLEESTQKTTHILQPNQEEIEKKPKARATGQQRIAKRPSEKLIEEPAGQGPVNAEPDVSHQANPPPKKKKLVRRVRVPRTTTNRATSEQNASTDMVNMVNKDDSEPPGSTNRVDSALLESVPSAPLAKRAYKTHKRILFNDDSDVDLDQMLNGIAAIAGTKEDTKTFTSRSSRGAKRKIAV